MAAPLLRGVGAFGSGATSFTAAVPAGVQAGDAMYIIMESADSSVVGGTPNTPSGWSKLFEQTFGAASVSTLTIFGKIAGASETDVVVDGVGDHCAGAMVVVYNHGLSVIGDTVVGTAADHGTTQANNLTPSISVDADSFIIQAIGLSDDANDTTNVSGVVNANLADITEQIDRTINTGTGGGVGIYTATCAGTTTGTTEWDHDTAIQSESLHLGIKPLSVQTPTGLPASTSWGIPAAIALALSLTTGSPAAATWGVPNATAQPGQVSTAGSPAFAIWTPSNATAQASAAASGVPASANWGLPNASAEQPGGQQDTAGLPGSATWGIPNAVSQTTADAAGLPTASVWSAPNAVAQPGQVTTAAVPPSASWGIPNATASQGSQATGVPPSAIWTAPSATAEPGQVASAGLPISLPWAVPDATATPGQVASAGLATAATWAVPNAAASGGGGGQQSDGVAASVVWAVELTVAQITTALRWVEHGIIPEFLLRAVDVQAMIRSAGNPTQATTTAAATVFLRAADVEPMQRVVTEV